jgi:hypothetical protein
MKIENIDTINFQDHGEGGDGCLIVRRCDDFVALCISLKENGDIEGVMDKKVALSLIEALQKAVE